MSDHIICSFLKIILNEIHLNYYYIYSKIIPSKILEPPSPNGDETSLNGLSRFNFPNGDETSLNGLSRFNFPNGDETSLNGLSGFNFPNGDETSLNGLSRFNFPNGDETSLNGLSGLYLPFIELNSLMILPLFLVII